MKNWKAKLASTTFWAALLGVVAPLIASAAGSLPATWAVAIGTASAAAYALSRGLTKWGGDLSKGVYSSEFWIGAAQIAILVAYAVPGDVSTKVAALLAAIVAALYQVSRGMSVSATRQATATSVTYITK